MKLKTILSALIALAVIAIVFVMAQTLQAFFGLPPVVFVAGIVILALAGNKQAGSLCAGLYPEVWTNEMIKRFTEAGKAFWRNGIPNKSQYASFTADGEAMVINLTYFGASPDVLIDNNTYPIPIQELNGENIPISLRKFQTKATPVTDDEIRGLVYDKIRVVQEAHAIKIEEEKDSLGIHSIAPVNNNAPAAAPVLLTTGADDGTGRKKLLIADIIRLKKAFDDYKVPEGDRRLVLCSDHVNDLLGQNQSFDNQYYNYTTGKLANMFGFELYTYVAMPFYNVGTRAKLSYGGTPVAGTHNKASVAFHLSRVGQANGGTKAYMSESKNDPLNQRSLLNYRHFDLVLPFKNEGIGAIVSAVV